MRKLALLTAVCLLFVGATAYGQATLTYSGDDISLGSGNLTITCSDPSAGSLWEVVVNRGTVNKIVSISKFDDLTDTTTGMRSKEFAHDYRYFPEPDLVPVEPDQKWINEIEKTLGELPDAKKERFEKELGLSSTDAELLISTPALSVFFEETAKLYDKPKIVANWIMGDLTAYLKANDQKIEDASLSPAQLAEMLPGVSKIAS